MIAVVEFLSLALLFLLLESKLALRPLLGALFGLLLGLEALHLLGELEGEEFLLPLPLCVDLLETVELFASRLAIEMKLSAARACRRTRHVLQLQLVLIEEHGLDPRSSGGHRPLIVAAHVVLLPNGKTEMKESEDGSEDESEDGSEEGSEEGSEDESEDGSEDESEDESEDGSEDESEDGSEDESEDESEDGSEEGSEDESEGESEEGSEEGEERGVLFCGGNARWWIGKQEKCTMAPNP